MRTLRRHSLHRSEGPLCPASTTFGGRECCTTDQGLLWGSCSAAPIICANVCSGPFARLCKVHYLRIAAFGGVCSTIDRGVRSLNGGFRVTKAWTEHLQRVHTFRPLVPIDMNGPKPTLVHHEADCSKELKMTDAANLKPALRAGRPRSWLC